MQGPEIHIASFILQVKPENFSSLCMWLETRPNHTVPFCDQQKNKIIVVIETRNTRDVADAMEEINNQAGVVTISMVYHQVDCEEEFAKEFL